MPVCGFTEDIEEGEECYFVVDGKAELNEGKGGWTTEQVKWCVRIERSSFRWEK